MGYIRIMTETIYEYSHDKNQQLIEKRNISFEEVVSALENGQLLDIIEHPNKSKYPNQKMYVVQVNDYVYLVPFVEKNKQTVFLKTIFASRKAKKHYIQQ